MLLKCKYKPKHILSILSLALFQNFLKVVLKMAMKGNDEQNSQQLTVAYNWYLFAVS